MAHVELLRSFLRRRGDIVEGIEKLLNAQHKPQPFLQDTRLLSEHFEHCFFPLGGVTGEHLSLKRQLDEAHFAAGFEPRQTPGQHNDLIDAAEIMSRGFRMWQRTRWPGRHERIRCAHILFDLFLLRRLMLLGMRVWDDGPASAAERLRQVQGVLDELGATAPGARPVFLKDARWLFGLAQSPTTNELHAYFEVAERIAESLPQDDRIEINKAGARMAGGHLRSQLRHVSAQQAVSITDDALVLGTRRSNALDLATLVQALVPLLEAYDRAAHDADRGSRLDLADAICQGVSPDPELFVNRLDLLGPYTMIEHLFVTSADGIPAYTAMGQRHVGLLERYTTLIARLAKRLHGDCPAFRPIAGTYSPYGVLYGFSSRLLEHMALKALTPGAATGFSLEDVFTRGGADKLAWVAGWRNLPHVPREVAKLFEYPQRFAEEVFERVEQALRERAAGEPNATARHGRLVVEIAPGPLDPKREQPPLLPSHYVLSDDVELVAAGKAVRCDSTKLFLSRQEGELLVSYETPGGWVGISKDVVTAVLGAGHDARVALPRDAARRLKLLWPGGVSLVERASA
jgi:hypothetical protein